MWPSEAWAIWLYDTANIALIVGLIIGAVATVLIVWMGNVKETYLKMDLAKTTERAAKANERAANLENDAAQAKLELGKLATKVGPRRLNHEQFLKALEGQPKAPVQILYLRDDPEAMWLAQDIHVDLERAGWIVTAREPIPTPSGVRSGPEMPITMSVGGQPIGVTVVTKSISEAELTPVPELKNIGSGKERKKPPYVALEDALVYSLGQVSLGAWNPLPEGTLRIVVGAKSPDPLLKANP